MGVVIFAMTILRKEPSPIEKACWMLFITALMVGEIKNLYTTDREQTKTFSQISQNLDATKKGLDATADGIRSEVSQGQTQFATTMDSVNKTLRKTEPFADLEARGTDTQQILQLGTPMGFNWWYENLGADTAIQIRRIARAYIGKLDDVDFQTQIARDFEQHWKEKHFIYMTDVQPRFPKVFKFYSDPITQQDWDSLAAHAATIYVIVRLDYRDKSGHWRGDWCSAFQDPMHDRIMSHECKVLINHRYQVP